ARESVIFIQNEVLLGWMVRGIHYWNMVMLVLLVGLHMLRTFLSAAYKVPREITWLLGTLLLLLMVATAFTGGILRWDAAGYFDLVVGIKIASWTPVIGPWIADLWRRGYEINPATLTTTFSLHVWILPVTLVVIATIHIGLVVLQGQYGSWVNYEKEGPDAPPLSEDQAESHKKVEHEVLDPKSRKVNIPARTTWFYPDHVFKEAVVSLGLLLLVMIPVFLAPVPIEEEFNPATVTYTPLSMWFFLFIDQMFLLFPGAWLIPVGATIAEGVVFVMLALLPWLDRTHGLRPSQRSAIIFLAFGIIGSIFILAILASSRGYNYDFVNTTF
ncbi:MAG: cytochrome b N-terminal domain-containing protein, partial [Chloroflexota bacterium]